MTICEHKIVECPKHEGNWDCHSFCSNCEGFGEYCVTCGLNGDDLDNDIPETEG